MTYNSFEKTVTRPASALAVNSSLKHVIMKIDGANPYSRISP